jgi:D-alanyl-D-alanine carboxypeptidase (penicillin-binding protein 5/6)
VKIGFARDVLVTVPKGTAAKMKPALERKDPLVAPLAENAPVGKLKMMVDDKVLLELPVVALEPSTRQPSLAAPGIRCACG